MTLISILGMLLVATAVADPPPAQPVARVLKVEGKVTIFSPANQPRPAAALDTVYVGERIAVSANSQLVLAFRGDGRLERVKPGGEVTVSKAGCVPKTAVEAVIAPEAHRRTVDRAVRQLRPEGPAAATIVRAPARPGESPSTPIQPSATRVRTPIDGAVVLAARPSFTWPPAAKVLGYEFHLHTETEEIWAVSVHQPRLDYTGERALKPGTDYIWEVFAVFAEETKEKLAGGLFTLATEEQKMRATALEELVADNDITFLTLAAVWFEENQLIAEATATYERLVGLEPTSAAYWFALGRLYQQADRDDEAEKAFQKARQLRPTRRSPRPAFLERLRK